MKILSSTTYFDPQLQKFAIKSLKSIFNHFELPMEPIINFQKKLLQKDLEVIILIDYSQNMSPEQLTLSHTMSKYILDNLRSEDSIGLYAFNEVLYEAFPLQKKGIYKDLLEQVIKQLLIYPGGKVNLFHLIQITAAYLFDLHQTASQKKLMKYVQFNELKGNRKQDQKLYIEDVQKIQREVPISEYEQPILNQQVSQSLSHCRNTTRSAPSAARA